MRMKKIASLLLALVLVLAMAVPAFAADGDKPGSIEISNAVVDQTYKAYKLLDVTINKDTNSYSYTVATAWSDFFKDTEVLKYVDVDENNQVTWKKGVNKEAGAAALAKLAKAAIGTKTHEGMVKATSSDASATTVKATIANLDLGYYLVDSTVGALCSLNTTDPKAVITEKNGTPVNTKKVEEDFTPGKIDQTRDDADIGQTVNFKSVIEARSGAVSYKFQDSMSKGLTFDSSSLKIYKNPAFKANANGKDTTEYIDSAALTLGTDYILTTAGLGTDGDKEITFQVEFSEDFCKALTDTDKIYVYYSATLNEEANIGAALGNPNDSRLVYGNGTNVVKTPWSETKTYTWELPVFKYTEKMTTTEGGTSTTERLPLAGAEFELHEVLTNGNRQIWVVEVPAAEGTIPTSKVYRVVAAGTSGATKTLVTDATGKISIQGLDSSRYQLTETKAPDGFNKLEKPVIATIGKEAGAIMIITQNEQGGETSGQAIEVGVKNEQGTVLPTTGGIGTTIFYVVGSILLVGAAVLLITKRRMNSEK